MEISAAEVEESAGSTAAESAGLQGNGSKELTEQAHSGLHAVSSASAVLEEASTQFNSNTEHKGLSKITLVWTLNLSNKRKNPQSNLSMKYLPLQSHYHLLTRSFPYHSWEQLSKHSSSSDLPFAL